jgi:hypothetical protein
MQARSTLSPPPKPVRLPLPLNRLPWDLAQERFGVQGADFLGGMGKVLLIAAQLEFKAYRVDSKVVVRPLPPLAAQSEFKAYDVDCQGVGGTLAPPVAQSEMALGTE